LVRDEEQAKIPSETSISRQSMRNPYDLSVISATMQLENTLPECHRTKVPLPALCQAVIGQKI
jgi:hypothetical protein